MVICHAIAWCWWWDWLLMHCCLSIDALKCVLDHCISLCFPPPRSHTLCLIFFAALMHFTSVYTEPLNVCQYVSDISRLYSIYIFFVADFLQFLNLLQQILLLMWLVLLPLATAWYRFVLIFYTCNWINMTVRHNMSVSLSIDTLESFWSHVLDLFFSQIICSASLSVYSLLLVDVCSFVSWRVCIKTHSARVALSLFLSFFTSNKLFFVFFTLHVCVCMYFIILHGNETNFLMGSLELMNQQMSVKCAVDRRL